MTIPTRISRCCVAGLIAVAACGAACPTPEEVGHAPKKQLDAVQARADAAGALDAKRANDAAAIKE